eukprot:SAG31_NODE_17868_length_655_cov_1.035971_2_plen_99_part_01
MDSSIESLTSRRPVMLRGFGIDHDAPSSVLWLSHSEGCTLSLSDLITAFASVLCFWTPSDFGSTAASRHPGALRATLLDRTPSIAAGKGCYFLSFLCNY